MGQAAAHHAHVGSDHDRIEPEAAEDPLVCPVLRLVAHVEAGLVEVARVGVLHRELADADQAAARPRLVAELGLEVVELDRQLAIRADDVAQQVGDDLLVGHRQDHVAPGTILEPGELRPHRVVASRLAPQVRRLDHRHQQLLAADRVHLLADDGLDPAGHAPAERQQAVDARSQLADVAGPHEEAMGGHLGVGRDRLAGS